MQSSQAVGFVSRLAATGALVFAVLSIAHGAKPPSDAPLKPPFEITEDRPRCNNYTPKRQALFGTTHLHTGLSFDASIRFVDYANGNDPRGAYRFAQRKAPISIPEPSGLQPRRRASCAERDEGILPFVGPSRTPCIDEPLDWGAVTDHSEHFGVMGFCKNLGGKYLSESMSMECRMLNGFFYEPLRALNPGLGKNLASNAFTQLTIMNLGAVSKNTNLPVCNNNPELCARAEMEVWNEVQQAAEEAYDRTGECSFTSFVAYENASTPLLNNWHRNVIFRNDRVVRKPVNALDMAVVVNKDPTKEPIDTLVAVVPNEPRVWPVPHGTKVNHPLPQPFWNKLEEDCTKGRNVTAGKARRCDFITIPHNSNLGGGVYADGKEIFPPMFLTPYNTEDAKRHLQMEPLVEIYQDKGASECRYDPRYLSGTNTIDEFCAFEILDGKTLGSASGVGSAGGGGSEAPGTWGERAYVRNVWKDGIQYAAKKTYDGINPFKMGVVSASDSHTGVMGWHPENEQWPGHLGIDDAYPMADSSTIQNGTGGPSVVWAEENTRDSIFEALKRKETYGTSGPRMKVRFFGGWNYPADACGKDFVDIGYQGGVPMGGDLPARTARDGAPTFITAAIWDDRIKTKLQQIQIIKGWVDERGNTHERVYTVAGDPGSPLNPQAAIDAKTCKARPELGRERLCAVWKDPDFDPKQHAFYYVRVLEEPVCRYSTLWCRKWIGVDPLDTDTCNTQLAALQSGNLEQKAKAAHGAKCCSNQTTDTFVQPVIQERAWTSPIWYEPATSGLAKK
jgi:Protein of unknown function (DUF3604)